MPMATKNRASLVIRGGLTCAVLGPLIGGCVFVLIWAVRGNLGLAALSLVPVAVIVGAFTAAPFGFMVGSVGIWWLAGRALRVSGRRLYFEAAGGGAVLGATYPLVIAILGWGPFENLVAALPVSIGTGVVCGMVLTREVRE